VVGTGGVDACENKATSRQHNTKGIPAMQTLHHALRRHSLPRALPTSRCSVAPSPTGRPTAGVQRRTGNPQKEQRNGIQEQALTMLVRNNLPELGSDLVAALPTLDMDDLAHACWLAA